MRSAPVLRNREPSELEGAAGPSPSPKSGGWVRRAGVFFLHELREMLPPTIFFFIGFNLIVLTRALRLRHTGHTGCVQ